MMVPLMVVSSSMLLLQMATEQMLMLQQLMMPLLAESTWVPTVVALPLMVREPREPTRVPTVMKL